MQTDVHILADAFVNLPGFDVLVSLARGKEGYLVGGSLRDALVGLCVTDIDLVFPEDPTPLAKAFAEKISGNWFWLDESRRQSRVVVSHNRDIPDYDFAPFRASTLGQDLLDRDFTVNCIAASIDDLFSDLVLVDPLCGVEDLEADILRMASATSFINDPLRILKGVRHATSLGLSIDPETLRCMQKDVTELYRVAPERIRQEVWKIFSPPWAARGLQLMSQTKVGNYLFGNAYSLSLENLLDVLDCYLQTLQRLASSSEVVKAWLAEEIEQGLGRETLLLWALSLNALDRELPLKLAEEWLLSRRARHAIASLGTLNEGHVEKFADLPMRNRAFAWWADFLGIEPKLLWLALPLVASDRLPAENLCLSWLPIIQTLEIGNLEDLISGHWLRVELGLADGPEMSRAQKLVRHAEINGDVSDEESAKQLLRQHYANMD